MLDTAKIVYLAMLCLKIIARISNHDDHDDEMEINTIEVMLSFFVVAFDSPTLVIFAHFFSRISFFTFAV